jgi:hypothetical protein
MSPKVEGQLTKRPKNRNSTVNISNYEKHAAKNSDQTSRLSNVGLYFCSLLSLMSTASIADHQRIFCTPLHPKRAATTPIVLPHN